MPSFAKGTVIVLLGDGNGRLLVENELEAGVAETPDNGGDTSSVAVGNFNGDIFQDLAITNKHSFTILIYLGIGNGDFQSPLTISFAGQGRFSSAESPHTVVVKDVNRDGFDDLAVAMAISRINHPSNNVSVFLGDSTCRFPTRSAFFNFPLPVDLIDDDFNGDGIVDIAVADAPSDTISILLGNGNGGFTSNGSFNAGEITNKIALYKLDSSDFNSDGNADLAIVNFEDDNVSVLFGDGNGSFSSPVAFKTDKIPGSIDVHDFNSDGFMDIATSIACFI